MKTFGIQEIVIDIHQIKNKVFVEGHAVDCPNIFYFSPIFIVPETDVGGIGKAVLQAFEASYHPLGDGEVNAILKATKSNWRTLAWDAKYTGVCMRGDQIEINPCILAHYDISIQNQEESTYIMSSLDPEELGSKVLQGLSLYKIDPKVQKRIDETRRKQALRREERAKLKAEKLKNS